MHRRLAFDVGFGLPLGFTNVKALKGGVEAWTAAGYPMIA
jgi:rhodanese-related sulfurtransferase